MKFPSRWLFRFLVTIVSVVNFFINLAVESALADEVTIVVIETDPDGEDDDTDDNNKKNLPNGAKAVEAISVKNAVDQIDKLLGDDDCIKNLHFRGHGSPGNQSVGDGTTHREGERINGHSTEWQEELQKLKFCDDATVHLWGCNVGSCDEGAAKLQEIANTLNVTARGAVNTVYAGQQENYKGPIQVATPNQTQPPECIPAKEEKAPKKQGDLVRLVNFKTSSDREGIHFTWSTGAEIDNDGMNIWCAQMKKSKFKEIAKLNTETTIPTQAIPPNGAFYSSKDYPWINTNLKPGIQHCTLEDIDASGQCTLHCDHIDTVVVGDDNGISDTELNKLRAKAIALCNELKQDEVCLDQLLTPNQ